MRYRQPLGTIQVGSVSAKLVAAYGLKGKVVAPNLGQELVPVVLVDDLANRPSWYGQTVERPAGGGMMQFAPAAGQFGSLQLFNPGGSGLIVLVETIIYSLSIGVAFIRCDLGAALPTVQTTGTYRDTRLANGQSLITTSQIRSDTSAATGIGSIVGGTLTTANFPVQYPIGFTLLPGNGLKVCCGSADAVLSCMFLWRERTIENLQDVN